MPAQARDLCRRQALLFAEAGPLDLPAAKLALQPAINIGRLSARNGDGDTACQHFQTLFEAAQSHADTTIDGLPVRFCTLTRNSGDHHEITQWLWTILLSDGARALASAGRWQDAARMAEQNNGIGQRLLDGRQILILAHCHRSDYEAAFSTLTSAITPTAWEQAVAACLEGTCRTWRGEPAANGHTAGVISSYLSAGHTPEPVTFRVRLGLCAIDVTSPVPADSAGLARLAAREALDNGDAYAAYDVITHLGCLTYTEPGTVQALRETVRVAALRQGLLPADILEILMTSVQDTEAAITTMLRR
jgi:hypothetical protein